LKKIHVAAEPVHSIAKKAFQRVHGSATTTAQLWRRL